MQHEQLDERRGDHDAAERERRWTGKKWHQEQHRARHLERAGEITKPLADADVVKEHDHVVAANQLRSAHNQEHHGERDLGELDENAMAVHPRHRVRVRLAPASPSASCQRRPHVVERRNESDDTDDLSETDVVQHCLKLRSL